MKKRGTTSRGRPTGEAAGAAGAGRRYDSSRRQADAAARQRRVVAAARELFLSRGYGATSIADIAREAGVSAPTVYAQFESKAGVLSRVVDAAVAGDDEDAGLAREWPHDAQVFDPDLDARARIRAIARVAVLVHRRSAALVGLVESVAGSDPAVAELAAKLRSGLLDDVRSGALLFALDELRPGLDHEDVVRIVHTLAGVPTYLTLTGDLGLSDTAYGVWLDDALTRLLLPDR